MPSWIPRTAAALSSALVFMGFCAWAYRPWWEYAFRSDDSPVSWLSSALLGASAAVALKLAVDRSVPAWLGRSLASALVLGALDEQFLLHERFKQSWPALGDLPTLLVGVAGGLFVWQFARRVRQPIPSWLMLAGVAVGAIALWADLSSPPLWLGRVEEGFEVVAETLFLCGLLSVSPPQVQSSSSS